MPKPVPYRPSDMLHATQLMSPTEELAWRRLCAFTCLAGETLPDNDEVLAELTRAGRKWRREVKPALLARGYIAITDGLLTAVVPRYRKSQPRERSSNLARARMLGQHTAAEWLALIVDCGGRCLCCESAARELTKDHIRAISRGGSDAIDNLQPLCGRCNSAKGTAEIDYRPPGWRERLSNLISAGDHA